MTPLKTEIQGKVATLTLNRPAQMNTIDLGMAKALYEASLRFTEHSMVRALIITCLLYTSPSPRDSCASRMPSSA